MNFLVIIIRSFIFETYWYFFDLGAKECVEGAKARLAEIVDDLEQMTELQCIVEQKHHRSILGNKGRYIQEISATWKVNIKFPERRKQQEDATTPDAESPTEPAADNKSDIIMIMGKKDNAEKARDALLVCIFLNL